jgi:hypothetical protein
VRRLSKRNRNQMSIWIVSNAWVIKRHFGIVMFNHLFSLKKSCRRPCAKKRKKHRCHSRRSSWCASASCPSSYCLSSSRQRCSLRLAIDRLLFVGHLALFFRVVASHLLGLLDPMEETDSDTSWEHLEGWIGDPTKYELKHTNLI